MSSRALEDPHDVRFVGRVEGLLRVFNDAGVLDAADVHVAQRLSRLGGEDDERVLLAAALAVRAVRNGSVCIDLATVRAVVSDDGTGVDLDELPWPEPGEWLTACAASPLVLGDSHGGQPLRLVHGLLYLDRYWRQEQIVRSGLDLRTARVVEDVDVAAVRSRLDSRFDGEGPDRQRLAAATAALRAVTVVVGGPGTGKTTTVALIIDLLRASRRNPRIALAAPTGKAAARLEEAIRTAAADRGLDVGDDLAASTVHRLLGWRPGSRSRFRHDRSDRLAYDVVIVDETSMVPLTLMARLIEALRPETRLVLVGDHQQLASVEAGAVLGDLVERPAPAGAVVPPTLVELASRDLHGVDEQERRTGVVRLTKSHRFGHEINELATAVQDGDPEHVLEVLRRGGEHVSYVDTAQSRWTDQQPHLSALRSDVVAAARALRTAAEAGQVVEALAAVEQHRLLVAHRQGPYGVRRWTDQLERWQADALGQPDRELEWYPGQPLLVTANDYAARLFNGDTGVVVRLEERGLLAAFSRGDEPRLLSPSRLSAVETAHAMTVHKAQGSQFKAVTLLLPTAESRALTRELLYTAVTRAEDSVRVIGSAAAIKRAVERRVARSSGLRREER